MVTGRVPTLRNGTHAALQSIVVTGAVSLSFESPINSVVVPECIQRQARQQTER